MTAPPGQHDELYDAWSKRLALVEIQVVNIHHNRQLWREMRDALSLAEADVFLRHYANLYSDSQAIAIRRIAEEKATGKTVSLGRLLGDLEKNPAVMTRARFVSFYRGTPGAEEMNCFMKCRLMRKFDERFGNPDGTLDCCKLGWRKRALSTASKRIEEFADQNVAHLDSQQEEVVPTFKDLDTAIDEIGDVFEWVTLLLTGSGRNKPDPMIQENWKLPFRSPLF